MKTSRSRASACSALRADPRAAAGARHGGETARGKAGGGQRGPQKLIQRELRPTTKIEKAVARNSRSRVPATTVVNSCALNSETCIRFGQIGGRNITAA